ncbi:DUF2442 domain-containing protein [Nitrosomonas sp. Is24]|uniref:DUF2442 domain-containing protein n=1 Tax=Nitrosomonas sp. Is24 TaxID=3080533 RepID=UPI000A0AD3B8|nr:DUF2442 domain-containing protein [Nitrosomonas sp. Is24]MDV6341636.1 DUF2442 domain-containing protein [Nitrosomonas sp. Is24]OQW81173.1 MAG: hypothetical protein BVN30_11710 [Proteobacteria bacterium ST_bin16]
MNKMHVLAKSVQFSGGDMIVALVDGRTIAIPLSWFPRLATASQKQLANYELLGDGEGIHWPDIDEDLSLGGLLRRDR